MRIFGFDIVKTCKLEQKELESYKVVTQELYNRLLDTLNLLGNIIDSSDESMDDELLLQMLFEHVETICHLILIYDQNIFSTPITAVSITQNMNRLRTNTSNLQNVIMRHQMAVDRLQYANMNFDEDCEETLNDLEDRMDGINERYFKIRKSLLKILFADVNRLISIIQYDLFLIIFGVDILREHRRQKKMKLKKKPNYEVKIFNNIESYKHKEEQK